MSSRRANGFGGEQPAWSTPALRDPRFSQSLERGLAILGVFTPRRPVRGIADIADQLGMSRSTTHRYVVTLTALGYLEQDAARKYRLGLRVTDLGMAAVNATGLREHAHPELEQLRRDTSHTASLAALDGGEVVYVDHLRSLRRERAEIELGVHVGSRLPVYCSAMGKVLLAYLPEPEQRTLLCTLKLSRRAANTITGRRALREELQAITVVGFAVGAEELAVGLVEIAAPVRDQAGEVIAAVGVSVYDSAGRVEELVDALVAHVLSAAARVSQRLGYRRQDETPAK